MGSIKKAFDLTGKTALVTGGSRGLGLQIAEALGEQGARIVLSSRKAADLKQAQEHLAGLGIKSDWIAADNANEDDVKRLADEAIDKLGKVDILVNNAGATWGASTEDHPIEAWDKLMNLNIRSLFLLSQRIGKLSMIPNKYGRIINIASVAGLRGGIGDMQMIAYHTSKGAVVNFTRALAGDWGRHGITVNALAPGFFPSKMTKGTLEAVGADKTCGECAVASYRRPRRSQRRSNLVRKRRRQTHHGTDTCHRRWFDGCLAGCLGPNIRLAHGMAVVCV